MQVLFKVLTFLVFTAAMLTAVPSHASITITPTRLVFQDGDRFTNVTLVNTSDETKTYNMGWEFFKMQKAGTPYKPVDQSLTEFDLSKYVMFTPRRVTLAAGGKQKIRLALRRPAEVPNGEYRAHLFFKPVPDADTSAFETGGNGTKKSSATVTVNIGYSIPVIFRAGKPDVTAQIEGLSLERNENNNKLEAVIPISRKGGAYGLLGHLFVYHQGTDGKERLVGQVSNAHLFPEVDSRETRVLFNTQDISGGNLRVVYKDYRKDNKTIFDERTFPLN